VKFIFQLLHAYKPVVGSYARKYMLDRAHARQFMSFRLRARQNIMCIITENTHNARSSSQQPTHLRCDDRIEK